MNRTRCLFFSICCLPLLVVLAVSCTGNAANVGDAANPERDRLYQLFDRNWQFRLDEDPLLATSVGDLRNLDRLPAMTPADLERRADFDRESLAALDEIDLLRLDEEDRINAEIFANQLRDRIALYGFGEWQLPLNADSGFHMDFAQLPSRVSLRSVEQYDAYIARLRAWPRYVGEQIANMRTGLGRGMTIPKVVLVGYEATIEPHVVERAEDSVFWSPFESFPVGVPESEHERLRAAGKAAIVEAIVPGYRDFLTFMTGEYIPGCRDTIAAEALPDGRSYYDQRVKFFTTLDTDAERVHAIGLAEVARIRAEMEQILEQVGYGGRFAEFVAFLRRDPRFYPKTGEQLLKEASYIAKQADAKLPSLFKTLPRLPYGVAPVPAHIAPKYTAGRYVDAPEGSTEPGYFWVNLTHLDQRPLYALTSLALHEAVPGHHLQGSLAKEQAQQPPFRRYDYISAFGEGWGLYAEWLGIEMGLYKDPYSNFGRLTYEMWRACRLVVDTGMHAKGWTRDQALMYLADNTALSLLEVRTEIDRYISWPGQALAYKSGEMKLRELRQRAERELGERFDVREFHDVVLRGGSVPLPILERSVERYLAAYRAP